MRVWDVYRADGRCKCSSELDDAGKQQALSGLQSEMVFALRPKVWRVGVPYDCEPEVRLGERRLALGGLKKGKHFQICPGVGCGRKIELAEACNAMNCRCGTNFCFICGEHAEPESENWLRVDGGCPRYGAADSERAMFDDDFDDADDNANANVPANHMEIWERGQGESITFSFIR